jgi:hypothetical protein
MFSIFMSHLDPIAKALTSRIIIFLNMSPGYL